ncbi:MAG: hypothetical protein ABUL60_35240 [Myxococcales bacterium]
MKHDRRPSRWLRRLALLGPCALATGACERPQFSYSNDVPVVGNGASSSFGGSFSSSGSFTGGSTPTDPCALDRSVSGTPIFAKEAISNQLPVRPELYAQLTDTEVTALRQGGSLLPPLPVPPVASTLSQVLNATLSSTTELRKPLIQKLLARFKSTRTLWPNPWALRLVDHPSSEHMNPVQIVLNPNAWVVRIFDGGPPTIVDVKNNLVSIDEATAAPERIAAVYYVWDDRLPGNSTSQCESGRREIALGNEAMVDSFSIGTPEILARLTSDIADLTSFFNVVRPCASVERGSGTFRSFTVCQTWHFFDASTEYSAYQWALSSPTESYKPKTQNLAILIDALKNDRFEPDPFVGTPPPTVNEGGAGGAGGAGAGGAPDTDLGGAGAGGTPAGGAGSPP